MQKSKIIHRHLGKTGIACPPIIYGTSYLGNLYRELTEAEKQTIIREWFNVSEGPVVIDTAGKYGAGLALETLGKGLTQLGISPEKITISNKLGWYRVALKTSEPTFEPGAWANIKHDAVQKISYKGILECWEQGCELLGDYQPQLVSVHDPDEYLFAANSEKERQKRWNDIKEAYQALFELKEKGKATAVGIGSKDWQTIRQLYNEIKFDWVMLANTFTLFRHPPQVLEFIQKLAGEGVGIINSGIFNAGFLTGGSYFDYRLVSENEEKDQPLFEWRKKFFSICNRFSVKPGDACLQFAISAPQISAVALNPGKPTRIKENIKVLENELSSEFRNELKKSGIVNREYPYL
ncbi:MAG: aldo/keto reductase [Prolixibacteraceae bacterium]|nr:aldo/keto reductase [Prolixibacteraceae bacterium]